jgi:diguanylate cyclase (GGDEF)-like protein
MEDDRLVRQATRTARRVILGMLAGVGVVLLALVIEHARFLSEQREATARIRQAEMLSGKLLLADETLTMSATLAAASGDERWIDRYDAHVPPIDAAIGAALTLASGDDARRYQAGVKVANDSLVALEAASFAFVRRRQLDSARAVLTSPAYLQQKRVLAEGQTRFVRDLQAHVEARARELRHNSWMIVAALCALTALGFWALWRRLNADLLQAENAFRDTQREMTQMALHDTLTGLPNRRYLYEQLERAMARRDREAASFATLLIDLDGFKPINDRFGHGIGDQVLITIGQRLATHVRRDEVAARIGGDEFVVMMQRGGDDEGLLRAAARLVTAIAEPIMFGDTVLRVGASVGIAVYPDDASDAEELVRRADVAMYRAKHDGLGGVRFFQSSMDAEVHERAMLETDLRSAIAAGEIVPFFQPLIDLQTQQLTGFEVLARWQHPTRGMLPPDTFIQIAEDTRLIGPMTMSLLRMALRDAATWDPSLMIAVNIAPQMLEDESLVEQLVAVAHETAFPTTRLEIEITESAFIRDVDVARTVIAAFKRHGISVALDDFGTGYSSLSHLSELPFDKIKIDRSFIRTMRDKPQSATIVMAIIGLGQSMQLMTTAEGIEDHQDEQVLRDLGCVSGQGFLYSQPVPAAEIPAFIAGFDASRTRPSVAA